MVSKKLFAMRKYGLIQLVLCGLLALSLPLSGAWGQSATVEDFYPSGGWLESVVAADGAWARGQSSDPTHYDMKFVVSPELELRRNFGESVVPHKDALVGSAIQRELTDSLSLELASRTHFGFSREINSVRDLTRALLSGEETKTLSLSQGFGSGTTVGILGYKRIESAKFAHGQGIADLLTEIISLESGLGNGYNVAAKLQTTDSPDPFGLHQRIEELSLGLPMMGATGKLSFSNFEEHNGIHDKYVRKLNADLPLTLSGGPGKLGFSEVRQMVDGSTERTRTAKVDALLAMFGGQASTSYTRIATDKNGSSSARQTLDFSTPLDSLVPGASFSHQILQVKEKKQPDAEVRTSLLETPWQMMGAGVDLSLRRITKRQANTRTATYDAQLATQLEGKPLTAQYLTAHSAGGTSSNTETLKIDMPALNIFGSGLVEYNIDVTHKDGTKTSRPTMDLALPLGFISDGAELTYDIKQVERKKKPIQEVREFGLGLPLQLFGADVSLSHLRKSAREPGDYHVYHDSDLSIQTQSLALAYHLSTTHGQIGATSSRPTMDLAVPLGFLGDGVKLVHTIKQIDQKKKPHQEVRETLLEQVPLDLFGATARLSYGLKSIREAGDYRVVRDSSFTVPLAGESLKITRQFTNVPLASGVKRTGLTTIDLPEFKLFSDNATITARHAISENTGRADYRKTDIDVTYQPLAGLELIGNYQIDDHGASASRDRQALARWHLTKNLSLNALFHQLNDSSDVARMVRNLYLTRESADNGLSVQAGYTTWGQPGEDPDGAGDLRVSFGDTSYVQLTGRLSEYDEKKWQRYDQPILQLALVSGDPDKLSVKLEYEDHPARLAPMQGIKFAFPALGGDMKLGAVANPVGRDGKTVQSADLFEVSLNRPLFSGINMDAGYRYWDYGSSPSGEAVIDYVRCKLEGGEEDDLGKLAVGFRSGDFVPDPSDKKKALPKSILEVDYAKSIGSAGRILVQAYRAKFADPNHGAEGGIEGQLECGSEDALGKLVVGFSSGDRTPKPEDKKKPRAEKIAQLKYTKSFGDMGQVHLAVYRPQYPDAGYTLSHESLEGALKYGHLTLGYQSGVAVPRENGQKIVPYSVFSLQYEDRWTENSRLIITLNRTTPPQNREDLERSLEGRVEYTTPF